MKSKIICWMFWFSLFRVALGQTYLSPCDIDESADGKSVYITASTGRLILQMDLDTHLIIKTIALPGELTGLAVSSAGMLYISGGGQEGRIWAVNNDGVIVQTIKTGHTPTAPLLSPDEKTLYVCNRFDADLAFIDLASGRVTDRVPVQREPVAMDITQDGRYLFVANYQTAGPVNEDYVASVISRIDTHKKTIQNIKLINGATGVNGVKLSPDGTYIYVTHFLARFHRTLMQVARGWVSSDALSMIRVADSKLIHTVLLDDFDEAFSNPWSIAFSDDGKKLIVSAAGSHELSLLNLSVLNDRIKKGVDLEHIDTQLNAHNNLTFLKGIRERVPLNGNGPRAILAISNRVYAANYFSDTIDVVDINALKATVVDTVELNPEAIITPERKGETLFNDATLCFQKWLSCSSCHPDGRADGLNWDLLHDGIGNAKNVKSLLKAYRTPPIMWLSKFKNAQQAIRNELKAILFSMRPESDAVAIDAYLQSLKPIPSPHLIAGKPNETAQQGAKLFRSKGCVLCHRPPLYTNKKRYDVGTLEGADIGKRLDVPSLIESWRTAPYLHDGRAETFEDVLRMNHFKKPLSEEEILQLAEFLRTI